MEIDGSSNLQEHANAINSFGLQLAESLFQDKQNADVSNSLLVSPFGIQIALGLAAQATSGSTKEEILAALHLKDLQSENFKTFQKDLKTIQHSTFQIANGIYAQKGLGLKESFVQSSKEDFESEVKEVAEDSTTEINNFITSTTSNKLQHTLTTSPSQVTLVNGAYFKGEWLHKFLRRETASDKFVNLNGEKKKVKLMYQRRNFRYYENDIYQALELPYEQRLSAYVFLPHKDGAEGTTVASLTATLKNLRAADLNELDAKFSTKNISVYLPRFKLEWKRNIVSSLQSLGIEKIFSQPDLSPSFEQSAGPVTHVIHHSYIEVNEEGSESTSEGPFKDDPDFIVRADRSFLYLVRDRESGAILFLGIIDEFISESSRDNSEKSARKRSRSPRRSSRSPRRSPRRRSPVEKSARFGREDDRSASTCLFIGNLPRDFRDREVEDLFATCGRIRNVRSGANKERVGYAFVEFEDRRDAEDAFEKYKDYDLHGSKLRVDWDVGLQNKRRSRPPRRGPPRGGYDRSPPRRRYSRSPPRYRRYSRSPPRRRSPSPRRRSPPRYR